MTTEPTLDVGPPPTDPPARSTSVLRVIAGSPLLRGAAAAMTLSGIGTSAAAPMIARFLVDDLGASLTVAGLYYLTNLTAPITGFLIGYRSDRTGGRLGLFRLCAIVSCCAWSGVAVATQAWIPFVIMAVAGGCTGAATSQIYAAVHDELARSPQRNEAGIVAVIRMSMTLGWVVGPLIGSVVAAQVGVRAMFVVVALCTLSQIVPLGTPTVTRRARQQPPGTAASRPAAPGLVAMLPLLCFTGLYILVATGEPMRYGYLPIYLESGLHASPRAIGMLVGLQPLAQLVVMPLVVVVARRVPVLWLLALASGLGAAAHLCFVLTGHLVGVAIGQTLMAMCWALYAPLGILVAQRLLPTAVATASGIYLSALAVAQALGGVIGGVAVRFLGLPHVHVVPAALATVSAIGLIVMSRRVDVDR